MTTNGVKIQIISIVSEMEIDAKALFAVIHTQYNKVTPEQFAVAVTELVADGKIGCRESVILFDPEADYSREGGDVGA